MAYTNTKTWKGNLWVVTPTTILISNVTGKVSSQNILSLIRINILLSKVSKLCILKKCDFPWNTNRRRRITLSLWNQWSVHSKNIARYLCQKWNLEREKSLALSRIRSPDLPADYRTLASIMRFQIKQKKISSEKNVLAKR